jgi:hypothetical protein
MVEKDVFEDVVFDPAFRARGGERAQAGANF